MKEIEGNKTYTVQVVIFNAIIFRENPFQEKYFGKMSMPQYTMQYSLPTQSQPHMYVRKIDVKLSREQRKHINRLHFSQKQSQFAKFAKYRGVGKKPPTVYMV